MRRRFVPLLLSAALVSASAARAQETVIYGYDGLGRLTSACFVESNTRIAYTYDATGNRSSVVTSTTSCSGASNQPPQAFNDSVSGNFPTFNGVVVDAIANDSDPENDSLTITDAVCLTSGCLVFINDNKLSIIGTTAGTKSVTYTISDGRGGADQALATVSGFQSPPGCEGFEICF